jgi:hypothetical protein
LVKNSLLYFLLAIVFTSCSKGGGTPANDPLHNTIDPNDSTFPEVVVNTPTDNQVFASGNVIAVTGKVSDNSLYRGSISITNDATGFVVKDQAYEIHYIPVYDFSLSYTASVTTATDFTVTVKFEDHGANQTVKTVKVKVNP